MNIIPISAAQRDQVVKHLISGEVILLPTDTIWGFHARADDQSALQKIQYIKQRPFDKPCVLLIADLMMALQYVELCPITRHLLSHLGDQGLTVLAKRKAAMLPQYFPTYEKLAIRIPGSKTLQKIIHLTQQPLISTSANRSGKPALNTIPELIEEFANDSCHLAEDRDFVAQASASTIVEVIGTTIKIQRAGSVGSEEIEQTMQSYMTS